MEAETNEFLSSIQSLIATIETRHQNLVNIRPMEELNDYVKTLNHHSTIVRVPVLPNPNDIFTLFPIQKYIKDGSAVLQYEIVLGRPETFTKYVVVSVPEENRDSVILENNSIVQVIISNKDNSSYFYPEKATEIFPYIFDDVKMHSAISCTSSVLHLKEIEDLKKFCLHEPWNNRNNYFPVEEDAVVIVRLNKENISIDCGQQVEPIIG